MEKIDRPAGIKTSKKKPQKLKKGGEVKKEHKYK